MGARFFSNNKGRLQGLASIIQSIGDVSQTQNAIPSALPTVFGPSARDVNEANRRIESAALQRQELAQQAEQFAIAANVAEQERIQKATEFEKTQQMQMKLEDMKTKRAEFAAKRAVEEAKRTEGVEAGVVTTAFTRGEQALESAAKREIKTESQLRQDALDFRIENAPLLNQLLIDQPLSKEKEKQFELFSEQLRGEQLKNDQKTKDLARQEALLEGNVDIIGYQDISSNIEELTADFRKSIPEYTTRPPEELALDFELRQWQRMDRIYGGGRFTEEINILVNRREASNFGQFVMGPDGRLIFKDGEDKISDEDKKKPSPPRQPKTKREQFLSDPSGARAATLRRRGKPGLRERAAIRKAEVKAIAESRAAEIDALQIELFDLFEVPQTEDTEARILEIEAQLAEFIKEEEAKIIPLGGPSI